MARRCVWSSNFVREEAKARYRAVKYTPTMGCVVPGGGEEGNRYTNLETYGPLARRILFHQTYLWEAAKSAVCGIGRGTLNELKTAVAVYIRNIWQTDLQKMFSYKSKRVKTCMDTRGHHFQHFL